MSAISMEVEVAESEAARAAPAATVSPTTVTAAVPPQDDEGDYYQVSVVTHTFKRNVRTSRAIPLFSHTRTQVLADSRKLTPNLP